MSACVQRLLLVHIWELLKLKAVGFRRIDTNTNVH